MNNASNAYKYKLRQRPIDSVCAVESSTNRQWTTGQFAKCVNALAELLCKQYPREIMVCEDNCAELMFLYFAGMVAGKVIIPIDPEKEASEVERIRSIHSRAKMLQRGELVEIVQELETETASDLTPTYVISDLHELADIL